MRERELAAQEARLEQEEDMWRHHESHRAEIEEQRLLLAKMDTNQETTRAEAELELEETRRKLAEEKAMCK